MAIMMLSAVDMVAAKDAVNAMTPIQLLQNRQYL